MTKLAYIVERKMVRALKRVTRLRPKQVKTVNKNNGDKENKKNKINKKKSGPPSQTRWPKIQYAMYYNIILIVSRPSVSLYFAN